MTNAWLRLRKAGGLGVAAALLLAAPAALPAAAGPSAELVHIPTGPGRSHPLDLRGYLRRPAGDGPIAAAVLLHGCGGNAAGLDRNWGARLQSWGYVSLTVDSFGPRGITNSCRGGAPAGRSRDAFDALRFLVERPFVKPSRVALIGFSEGGLIALFDVEPRRGGGGTAAGATFRAAVAFYPSCAGSGVVSVPTLVLNGALDDWSSAEACRKMVAQESDIGVTRHKTASAPLNLIVLPDAYHKFDDPAFQPGRRYMGHRLDYDPAALALAADAVHRFLRAQLGAP